MRTSIRVSCVIIILLCNYFCTSETYKRIESLSSSNNIDYINSTIKKVLKTGNEKIPKDSNNILIILGYQCNDYNPECYYRGVVFERGSQEKYYFEEIKSKKIRLVDDKENYEIINYILALSINNNSLLLKEYEGVNISHLQSAYYIYNIDKNSEEDDLFIYRNLFMDNKGFLHP